MPMSILGARVGALERLSILLSDSEALDPGERVYERLLRHRHVETVPLDTVLAVRRSVYEFTVARADVVPTESEATDAIREAEARGLADVDGWWAL